jgi:hypothetical protein
MAKATRTAAYGTMNAIAQASSEPHMWRCQDGRHDRFTASRPATRTCGVLLTVVSSPSADRVSRDDRFTSTVVKRAVARG